MKNLMNHHSSAFDGKAITDTIQRALASAGLDTTTGPMSTVMATVQQALSSSGVASSFSAPTGNDSIIDVVARVIESPPGRSSEAVAPSASVTAQAPGSFETHEFNNAFGARGYKLYVPTQVVETPPMVVMLHGCTQSAADFAAGTRMNRLAEEHGFLVLYPEQPSNANPSKCWNWFKVQDQVRESGEPGLLTGMVRDVAARHRADPRRIFVAGLSAGAAMAVVLGQSYPELFAGVGAHSGLPYASAHDIPSALAAMKGGRSGIAPLGVPFPAASPKGTPGQAVPTIVFHGDRDHTVQHSNGVRIVDEATRAFAVETGGERPPGETQRGKAAGGRSYSRTVYGRANGIAPVELWTLHGAGHAWSGGDASGSYTDGSGPDASAEMIRFFMALPRAGSA